MKRAVILLFIMAFAFTIRINYVVRNQTAIESDEVTYDSLAVNLVGSKGYAAPSGRLTSHRPPLYPVILSMVYRAFGHSHFIVRLIQALIGALTVCIFYLIGGKIFNEPVAIITGIFSSAYMIFIYYTGYLYTETFFSFLLAIAVFMIVTAKGPGIRRFAALGVLCGLLTLLRTTGFFVPVIACLALLAKTGREKGAFRRASAACFALVICFAITLLPWTVRNYKVHGRLVFVSTNGGLNMYQAIRPLDGKLFEFGPKDDVSRHADTIKNEADRNDYYIKSALSAYREEPAKALKLLVMRLLFFWNVIDWNVTDGNVINYQFIFILPFAIFGTLLSLRNKKDVFVPLAVIMYFTSLVFIFQGFARFRMPIDGYIIMLGSYGIYEFVKRHGNKMCSLAMAGGYFCFTYALYRYSVHTKHIIKTAMEKIGLW